MMEEEEPSEGAQANEAQGEKRKAEGDEMELERSGGQAESSSNGMAIEAVMMNDEEAWDDVRRGWLDREKVRGGKVGGGRSHGEKEALGRSVEKRSVGSQDSVCKVGGHRQMHREENPEKRCRLVAGDFRGPSKDREDLFRGNSRRGS